MQHSSLDLNLLQTDFRMLASKLAHSLFTEDFRASILP